MPHLLPALSNLVPAVASNQDDDKKSAPAYLYCKRKIYYFRYAFPANLRKSLGRAELRVSLQTSYLRIARFRARMLSAVIGNMILEGFMLDYKEIRRRMNILLQRLLEQDHADLSERKDVSIRNVDIQYDQLRLSQAEILLSIKTQEQLEKIAPACLIELFRSRAFSVGFPSSAANCSLAMAFKYSARSSLLAPAFISCAFILSKFANTTS